MSRSLFGSLAVAVVAVIVTALSVVGATGPAGAATGLKVVRIYHFNSMSTDWAVYDTAHTARPDARVASLVTVSGGALHVATSGSRGSGLCLCRGAGRPTVPYGRWDVRARATSNHDHGFAMLLWPNAENWPVGGEIDMAEFTGAKPGYVQTTVHYTAKNRKHTLFTKIDFTKWHTYTVVWNRTLIDYRIDGHSVMKVTDRAQIPTGPLHLGLQAGVANGVTSASATSARLDIDWIEVYR